MHTINPICSLVTSSTTIIITTIIINIITINTITIPTIIITSTMIAITTICHGGGRYEGTKVLRDNGGDA
jgi:hypothetical protein